MYVYTKKVVEKIIQRLGNSGYKFQFIRSNIQQVLTKYLYIVRRSKLDFDNKLYQPPYTGHQTLNQPREYCLNMWKLISGSNKWI